MTQATTTRRRFTRRGFIGLAGASAGAFALSGCGLLPAASGEDLPRIPRAARTGRIRDYDFEAAPMEAEVGGRAVSTWGYNGGVPGPEIRVTEGDTLRVNLRNRLPEETTIHWHGLPVENAMDGVPRVTQPPVAPGEEFVYEFAVPVACTYMYHSHVGLQLDRGLYGPLIVEPKNQDLDYDREYVLLLDDWLTGAPESVLRDLKESGGMGGGMGGGMMDGDSGDVDYPVYLINGRAPKDPEILKVRRGERVRLRLINPAADTIFRFAVAGHRLTVTHADGQPVKPVKVDSVRIGMGERYDVLLEAYNPGVWQVAAAPEAKNGLARAILRYHESEEESPPPRSFKPKELNRGLLTYADLRDSRGESSTPGGLFGGPDRTFQVTLSGGMGDYVWTMNGQRYPDAEPLEIKKGDWVSVKLTNQSMMSHPMHLHGHFFQVRNGTGNGLFKDTVIVEPHMGELTFDFVADNPGDWFFHCHNAYHMAAGMARVVSYTG